MMCYVWQKASESNVNQSPSQNPLEVTWEGRGHQAQSFTLLYTQGTKISWDQSQREQGSQR